MENEPSYVKRYSYLTSKIDTIYHEAAWRCGLSDSAMRVLYAICLCGEECRLSEIVSLAGIRKQTINSALRRLEGDGILELRLEKEKGRTKKAVLTEKGRELVEHTIRKIIRIENEVFCSWSSEEQERYAALTQKYLSSFEQKIKEADL